MDWMSWKLILFYIKRRGRGKLWNPFSRAYGIYTLDQKKFCAVYTAPLLFTVGCLLMPWWALHEQKKSTLSSAQCTRNTVDKKSHIGLRPIALQGSNDDDTLWGTFRPHGNILNANGMADEIEKATISLKCSDETREHSEHSCFQAVIRLSVLGQLLSFIIFKKK